MVQRIKHYEIDLSTKFQRKEGLWSDEQQSRLIESILIRFPLPVFYFDGSDNNKWQVIDGLQRLTALKRFMVTKELTLTGLEYLQLNGKGWDDFDRPQQRQINETQLQCYVLEEGEENVKFNIFKRINTGGMTLSSQEIRHAMHQNVSIFLKDLAESNEFLDATQKKVETERMQDRDFINRFLAFYILDYSKEYNKEAMKLAHKIFGNKAFSKKAKPNRINKALFEVVSVNFAKLNIEDRDILLKNKEKFIDLLYKTIDEKFKDSLSSGT